MVCAFTGHRPEKLPWGSDETDPRCLALKEQIADRVERAFSLGYREFCCGMARGCDQYFAEAVLALALREPEVALDAWLPCPEQADRWPRRTGGDMKMPCAGAATYFSRSRNTPRAVCSGGIGPCCARRDCSSASMTALAVGPGRRCAMRRPSACRCCRSGDSYAGDLKPWTAPSAAVEVTSPPMIRPL